jgi:AcrR family transcriptional regulator
MARVAKELGFTTMSLYRHVTGKEELLQLMYNASTAGAETVVVEGEGWRERVLSWSLVQREVLDRHPWITQMPMATPPVAPNSMLFVEHGLAALDDTGLDHSDKLRMLGLIASYTLSDARMANDAARAAAAAAAADAAPMWTFEGLLRELVDERTYPRLYRMAWTGDGAAQPDEHQEFLFGLDRILDGIQAYIDRA